MPTFNVSIPVTMSITITVEAENEEAAKAAAFGANYGLEVVGPDKNRVEIDEWETHDQVVRGNCYSGVRNEVDIERGDG